MICLNPGGGPRVLVLPIADPEFVFSFRGQVLPAASLLNIVDVELIYGGVKYILKVKAPGFSAVSALEAGGSFYFWSGLASARVLGLPRQSLPLKLEQLWVLEHVGLCNTHKV